MSEYDAVNWGALYFTGRLMEESLDGFEQAIPSADKWKVFNANTLKAILGKYYEEWGFGAGDQVQKIYERIETAITF